ncbi:uncharacterized protein [Primulina huaijiensis]|uniref:uncharacterized protein isoform X4 n=1 Tax=Primulina huaijiensis TaxID=1492673 RepID=UPI003CC72F9A
MLPFEASAICQKKNQKNCYEAVPGHLSMGNVVGSFSSGFAQLVNTILGRPLDFLAGKNCDSICGSTWDFVCYIENFCVTHLLKLVMVATLVYFESYGLAFQLVFRRWISVVRTYVSSSVP